MRNAEVWVSSHQNEAKAQRAIDLALLAASMQDPALLEPMRSAMETLARELEADGLPQNFSLIVLAAIYGLYFDALLPAGLQGPRAEAVIRGLRNLLAQVIAEGQPAAESSARLPVAPVAVARPALVPRRPSV